MERTYVNAKIVVSWKYSENDPYFPMYVLALNALLHHYPDYREEVIDTFIGTSIYIEPHTIEESLAKYKLQDEEYLENYKDKDYDIHYGVSSPGLGVGFTENQIVLVKDTPFLVCNSCCGRNHLLNVFIHEMNHLVKCSINPYGQIDDKVYVRSGLSYSFSQLKDKELIQEDYNVIIDEVINSIETTDMIKDIMTLDGIVPDKNIQDYIDSLNRDIVSKHFGYDKCTEILVPLWHNKKFRDLIQSNIVLGNIFRVMNEFDEVAGEDAFDTLAQLLDDLDLLQGKGKNIDEEEKTTIMKQITDIINKYNEKTKLLEK